MLRFGEKNGKRKIFQWKKQINIWDISVHDLVVSK